MAAKKQHSFLTLFLIIVLCVNLVNIQTVYADGETPTEPPAATQVETEQPTEAPVETTPVPVESEPSEPEATAAPIAETFVEPPATEAATQDNVTSAIVSTEELGNTDIVVLDEQGQALVLGSQDVANSLVGSEPVWCPESVSIPTPGANGCSASYAGIAELLAAMQADPQSFSENGTIFLEKTDSQVFATPFVIDDSSGGLGSSFTTLSSYNLGIQGGWNPATGTTSDQTVFAGPGAYIQVGSLTNPWMGSLTINNVAVFGSDANQGAVQIFASDVTLTNVTASDSDTNGISITASNAGTVTLNNVIANNNGHIDGSEPVGSGVFINGADTLINVIGGSFTDNTRYGIEALNSTSTTLPIANLWTDQADYSPGSVVTISGNDNNLNGNNIGFTPGETVLVYVQGPNGYTASCEAIADSYGAWSCQITLWESYLAIGDYTYTASGVTSGVFQTGTFTDGNATVSGTVSDNNGNPIVGATVNCSSGCNGNASTTSGAGGAYTLSFTFGGTSASVTINASMNGYTSQSSSISAGNGQSFTRNFTLAINDSTLPVITPSVSGSGWYNSDVTVSWTVSDPESGIASSSGCGSTTLTTETVGTQVTCSATNGAGLSSSSSVTIKIDKTAPTITFDNRTAPNANGWNNTNVTVNWSCTDTLSGPVSGTVSETLTTEGAGQSATGICTDQAGNTASDTQSGINIDKTMPVLSLPSNMTVEATSAAGANVNYSAAVSDNLDASVTISCVPASGSLFAMGDTTVNCSSTDVADNTANGSFQITVQDKAGPVIAAHPNETVEATSSAGAVVTYSSPSTFDVIDGAGIGTCSPASGETFPLGNTTVTCDAVDSQGNAATPTTFVVSVVDTTGPLIASHVDVTVEAISSSGAQVTYTSPSATDLVDGLVAVDCSPVSGTQFALGNTTVSCNAADSQGNAAATTTFTVHVVDTTAPVIAGHADVTVEATSASGAEVTYASPSATDIVDGSSAVNCSPASGNTFAVGSTTVTCNAMDTHGNLATPIQFTVHVVDTTAPTLTLPGTITANATSPAGAIVTYLASASDLVDGSVSVSCNPASGSIFPLGLTTVNCSATDAHGNSASDSFLVNVQDPDAPIITVPADMTVEATNSAGAIVNYSVSATDIVDGTVAVSCAPSSGSSFGFGTTTVNCSATDSNENTNTAAFLVTVEDTVAPTITTHSDFTTTTNDPTGVVVNYTSPSTADAVDGSGVASCFPASGSLFPIGDTQVTCTATDSHENSSSTSFLIHVTLLSQSASPTSDSTPEQPQSSSSSLALIIPSTGGELIDLDCNSVLWAFGIKLSFFNLCDQQTTIHSVEASNLPDKLPAGFSFVMGLNVNILTDGQIIKDLPNGSGIEMDFPIYNQSQDEFTVLYWSDEDGDGKGEWIEVSKQINSDEISLMLDSNGGDELYQLFDGDQSLLDLFYQTLTTQKTGTFVLVKK